MCSNLSFAPTAEELSGISESKQGWWFYSIRLTTVVSVHSTAELLLTEDYLVVKGLLGAQQMGWKAIRPHQLHPENSLLPSLHKLKK